MEEVPAERPRRRLRLLAVAAGLVLAGIAVAWIGLRRMPVERLVVSGAPRINLGVAVLDEEGNPVPATESRIGGEHAAGPMLTPTPTTQADSSEWWRRKTPTPTEPAERAESMELTRAPIAVSVYILDGSDFLEWMDDNPSARAFLDSDLVQGMLQDVMRTLHVRGEDLKVPGVQGAFLVALARDIAGAGAALHYDHSRGRSGYVLAFDRSRSTMASRLLPVLVAAVGKREYRLETPPVSIVEALVGQQRLFVTESDGLVYVSTSLPAVLNVIEVGPMPPPAAAKGTVAVRMRAEAWLRDLVPAMTGAKTFEVTWDVDLNHADSPGFIHTSGAAFYEALQPTLASGVLASLPHDAFAAAAASVPFPQLAPPETGSRFVSNPGARDAGIGVVWDFAMRDELISEVGIAARGPSTDTEAPDIAAYVSDKSFATKCAGGTIWLAASSEPLLARMREACERQSISMLDRVAPSGGESLPQIFLSVNPAAGLGEMLQRGIGAAMRARLGEEKTPSETAWAKTYRLAVERARDSAQTTLSKLPVVVFQGSATTGGATLTGAFEPQQRLARRVP